MTTDELRRLVARGELVHVRRGAYAAAQGATKEERHRQLVEATAPLLKEAVLSHYSAAVVHGLLLPHGPSAQVHVIRHRGSRGGGTSRGPLHVHASRLTPQDVTVVDGMRVTTTARTLVDLACCMTFDAGLVTMDAGLHAGRGRESAAMRRDVEGVLARIGRVSGVKKARDVLAFSDGRAESPLETRSRLLMWRMGIPTPEIQYVVLGEHGNEVARVDFAWPSRKIYGECDGEVKYGKLLRPGEKASAVVMREKRRDNALADLGWHQVRWMDADLAQPKVLTARIQRALAPKS